MTTKSEVIHNMQGERLLMTRGDNDKYLSLDIAHNRMTEESVFSFESTEQLDNFIKALFKLRNDME